MGFSLLSCGEGNLDAVPIDERVLYHFSLDRSFSYLCADVKKREYFLSVVRSLTDDKVQIIYRQEILQDFVENPTLFEQMQSMLGRFTALSNAQKNAGRDEYHLRGANTTSTLAAKNMVQTQAICLKRALRFVRGFAELMEKYDLHAQGLRKFQDACRAMADSREYAELVALCTKYENFSARGCWDFQFVLNDAGEIAKYALIDHRYIHVTDPDLKKRRLSLFKKVEESSYPCAQVEPDREDIYNSLAIAALSDISRLFSSLSVQIFARFGSFGAEMDFYDVALRYAHALKEKGVPSCYPIFSADRCARVRRLYDLYLLMSMANGAEIIPNDFVMTNESGGLIVFGGNGCGKTVYIRSIGTMQLLAQAGLPVPCAHAEVALFSQISTQFAEAEKEFCAGNVAGRFAQEVRELARMVDTLREGALIFLNETFQSTAYAEGAEGLYHLLQYFSASHIRWILVSHLWPLEQMFEPDEVTIGHMVNGKLDGCFV